MQDKTSLHTASHGVPQLALWGLDAMTQDTCHDREATAELDALRRRVAELESAATDFQRDLAEYGEQAERYRIISELTSDYVYAMDVHEDGSVAPEWHTKGMAHMTGFQMDELNAKMASLQIIHPADRATVAAQLQKLPRRPANGDRDSHRC